MSIARWCMLLVVVGTGCARAGGLDAESKAGGEQGGAGGEAGATSSGGGSTSTSGGGGSVTCADNEKICGGLCKDLMTDSTNCGDCFNACASGDDCIGGLCADEQGGTGNGGGGGGGGGGGSSTGACSPLAPEPVCGPASHCWPRPDGNPICVAPAGSGIQYDYCTESAQCDPIHECLLTGNYKWCLQWCVTDLDCPNWYDHCTQLGQPVFVGTQAWGVCWNGVS